MGCLKPKLDTGNVLEDRAKHPQPDDGNFTLSQLIAGPLEVITKGSSHFVVPDYKVYCVTLGFSKSKSDNIFEKKMSFSAPENVY